MVSTRPPIEHYLSLEYPYTVAPDDGAFFIRFPDLPGCMTQVENAAEIGAMAEEIRRLWLKTAFDQGLSIPEPAMQSEFSGRFVVRVPKQLHKDLVTAARQQVMSLNAYVIYLLAERNATARVASQLDDLRARIEESQAERPLPHARSA
jgi:antitoxin HicB